MFLSRRLDRGIKYRCNLLNQDVYKFQTVFTTYARCVYSLLAMRCAALRAHAGSEGRQSRPVLKILHTVQIYRLRTTLLSFFENSHIT